MTIQRVFEFNEILDPRRFYELGNVDGWVTIRVMSPVGAVWVHGSTDLVTRQGSYPDSSAVAVKAAVWVTALDGLVSIPWSGPCVVSADASSIGIVYGVIHATTC